MKDFQLNLKYTLSLAIASDYHSIIPSHSLTFPFSFPLPSPPNS